MSAVSARNGAFKPNQANNIDFYHREIDFLKDNDRKKTV